MQNKLTYMLIGIAVADFLAAVDSTAVNIAMPQISRDFGITPAIVALIQIVYTSALVCALIPAGAIGDRFGHKKSFLFGLGLFALSSVLIIFAPSIPLLLLLRAFQGIAGGILYTTGGALIANNWENTEKAFGVTGATFSLGMLAGPILGGILTDTHIPLISGWRLIFAINLIPAIIGMWLIRKYANETPIAEKHVKIDLWALAFLIIFVTALTTSLLTTTFRTALIVLSLDAFFALLAYQYRHSNPLIDLKVFANRTFAAVSLYTTLCMATLMALSFMSTFYLQDMLHLSAHDAGIRFIPISLGMAVFAIVGGSMRNWKLTAVIGGIFIALGHLALSRVTPATPYAQGLLPGFVLVSSGAGLMMTTTFAAALGSVKLAESGLAAGYINTLQQLGGLAGVAFVAGTVLATSFHSNYLILAGIATLAVISALFIRTPKLHAEAPL
jgi:MFS family permease